MHTSSRKKVLFTIISLLSIIGYGVFVFAAPPGVGGYNPGEILDPECAPNDPDCIVAVSGGSGWSLTGNAGTTAGTNFIGTTDAVDFVVKVNGNQVALFGQNGNVAIGSANAGFGVPVPVASGIHSFTAGLGTTSSGIAATSFGLFSVASGVASMSWGTLDEFNSLPSVASGDGSTAFGEHTTASGMNSTTWGARTIASDYVSTAFGQVTTASGYNSTAFGYQTIASEDYAVAFGANSIASGIASTSFGITTTASGYSSTAFGTGTTASGDSSAAFGMGSTASGNESLAFGNGSTALGDRSIVLGSGGSTASGADSIAFGRETVASGERSTTLGYLMTAPTYGETALGILGTTYTPSLSGATSFNSSDRLFNIGNGYSLGNESDAFTILKNGKTGIGYDNFETTTFDSLLQVNGSILSSAITGCLFLSTDADGKITCSSGSGFIPLSGTTPGNLVTGSIEVHSGDTFDVGNGRTIYAVASGDPDITGGFSLQDDSDLTPVLWRKDHGLITSLTIKNGTIDIDAPDHNTEIFSVTGKIRVGDPDVSVGAVATFENTTGSCTINPTTTSLNCSSDERLKKNIEDITNDTLNTLLNVKTVKYNWNSELDSDAKHVGFIAQDLIQFYPELVSESDGYYQVNYAGMTPILVEAIREMNLNVTNLSDMTRSNTWREALIAWFGNVENGITEFFSKKITTDELCLKDSTGTTCYTREQLDSALSNTGTIIIPTTPTSNDLTTDSSAPNDGAIDNGISDENSNPDTGTGDTNNTEIVTNPDIPASE